MGENFIGMLHKQWSRGNFVCVGLDPEFSKIPEFLKQGKSVENAIFQFNRLIIDATKDLVCAYKPNVAFYAAQGNQGRRALTRTINYIKKNYPEVPVILDAKVGDIGNTNNGYVAETFSLENFNADAITVHPYLGQEALQPFLSQYEKGIIVLVRTSNPGAGEFQDLKVIVPDKPETVMPMYQYVAKRVATEWNKNLNCLVVVGATYPEELKEVREIVGDIPILIPGIGAQGGDLEKVIAFGKDHFNEGIIINSSRGIIFASKDANFAQAARSETKKLNDAINHYLQR